MNDIDYEPIKQPNCLEMILIGIMMVISTIFLRNPNRRKRRG